MLQVLCDAFVFCGDAFPLLLAFLALFGRLELLGCLDLFRGLRRLLFCRFAKPEKRPNDQCSAVGYCQIH